jgi:hypothetical protein
MLSQHCNHHKTVSKGVKRENENLKKVLFDVRRYCEDENWLEENKSKQKWQN